MLTQSIQIAHRGAVLPGRRGFNPPQVPLPQGILPGKPTQNDGHLRAHQDTDTAQQDDNERKGNPEGAPRNQQADDRDEDGIGGKIIRQHRMVVTNARGPEREERGILGTDIRLC